MTPLSGHASIFTLAARDSVSDLWPVGSSYGDPLGTCAVLFLLAVALKLHLIFPVISFCLVRIWSSFSYSDAFYLFKTRLGHK